MKIYNIYKIKKFIRLYKFMIYKEILYLFIKIERITTLHIKK